jgi:hypothetical protein
VYDLCTWSIRIDLGLKRLDPPVALGKLGTQVCNVVDHLFDSGFRPRALAAFEDHTRRYLLCLRLRRASDDVTRS